MPGTPAGNSTPPSTRCWTPRTRIPADREEYEHKLDEMVDAIHRMDLAGLGASAGIEEGQFEKAPLEDILQMTFPVDPKLKDKVREQVAATVSQLPLSVNDAILGYINYFSGRGHRTLVGGLQRSGRYRPMIQRILDEEGLPQELIHLAQAESGFIPRALSRKAAGGMWQFLKWRGNEYGLQQTRYTDDRMDPEKATRAAARHLRDLYQEFGDWYLAIAAYNCGPVVVEKAVERTGYADFWELRSRGVLPLETTNYVPVILAMTIMEKNAAEYGLDGIQLDPPLAFDTVEVSAPTSLALVSDITRYAGRRDGRPEPRHPEGHCPRGLSAARAQGQRQPAPGRVAAHSRGAPQFLARASCRRRRNAGRYRQTLRRLARQHRGRQPPVVGPSRGGRPAADSRGPARGGSRPADHRRADYRPARPPPRGPRPAAPRSTAPRPRRLWRRSTPLRRQPAHKSPPILTRTASR